MSPDFRTTLKTGTILPEYRNPLRRLQRHKAPLHRRPSRRMRIPSPSRCGASRCKECQSINRASSKVYDETTSARLFPSNAYMTSRLPSRPDTGRTDIFSPAPIFRPRKSVMEPCGLPSLKAISGKCGLRRHTLVLAVRIAEKAAARARSAECKNAGASDAVAERSAWHALPRRSQAV